MTLYLDDGDVRLYHGDAIEQLRSLPDGSVDMVATSPPFYGLRDYGTGEWEGGDEGCDHTPEQPEPILYDNGQGQAYTTNNQNWNKKGRTFAGNECPKCGARRVDRQIGLEETPDQWVANLVAVFRECRRVLADHGTLWVEIGDSYSQGASSGRQGPNSWAINPAHQGGDGGWTRKVKGMPGKNLLGQPWLLAFALRADGWYLRSEIIWARPNPMPESVTDRPTKSHSTVFLLSKQPRYFYDADAIREPHQHDGRHVTRVVGKENSEQHRNGERWPGSGANARSVWTIPTQPTPFAHFATWPRKLVARMIQAGTSQHGRCPECGKPWVRETSVELEFTQRTHNATATKESMSRRGSDKSVPGRNHVTTLGWLPTCDHDLDPVPCVVLDPFAGSGTTLLVARHHGRHAIGIELNADYCQIAADQLQQLSLLT